MAPRLGDPDRSHLEIAGCGIGPWIRVALVAFAWGFTLAVAGAPPLSATVFRVDGVAGSDSPGCGSEASPCASIQQAVDLASSGDTILVASSVYTDNVDCLGESTVVCVFQKQLTILGGFSSGQWSLPDPSANLTVIDGQSTRRGVGVHRGGPGAALPATSLRMEGFTVKRGRAAGSSNSLGGGLLANFADIVLRDMVFVDNVATAGSGGLGGGGGAALLADADNIMSVTLERILFQNNQAVGGGGTGGVGQGGGLLVDFATVTALSLEFQGNSATGGGSASTGKDGLGGGAAFTFGTNLMAQDLTAVANVAQGGSATTTGGAAFGGAIFLEGADSPAARVTLAQVMDSRFSDNIARGGSASTAAGGAGGAIDSFGAQLTLERALVVGNRAEGGAGDSGKGNAGGGGVFLEWPFSSTPPVNVIQNSILAKNILDASQGGGAGIRLLGTKANVTHTTLVDNRNLGVGLGLGILAGPRLGKASQVTVAYSILADHTMPSGGHAIYVQSGSSAILTNLNYFVGNSNNTNQGSPSAGTFVDFPGSNILDASPSSFFVNPATSDYHVDGTNPPTNAASGSSEPLDFDGASRSGIRDLGADEAGANAFSLSVGKIGVGSGTVTSSPAGIQCGADCFETYNENTSVTLTPTPDAGFSFTGWSGVSDCGDGSVLMTQDIQCVAQFEDSNSPPICSVTESALVLTDQIVTDTRTEAACNSITAGPSYTVAAAGDVTFESPTIVLRDGFSVSGSFVAISGTP